jgi:hypothetical protein
MFETKHAFAAHRGARRLIVFAACAAVFTFLPHDAEAAIARVRWLPTTNVMISRYDVYVRDAGSSYGTPAWSGKPSPAADGALEGLVVFEPATSGTNYFAVIAVTSTADESELSRELPTGTPVACRIDSCTSKTDCDFGAQPDGTVCDAGGVDPCGGVCVAGSCDGSGGGAAATDVALNRLRFTTRATGVKLSLKGKFETDAAVDPTASGAVIELRSPDGSVLYSASIGPESFTANAVGNRFHFDGADADPAWNGLTRMDLRLTGSGWIVTAQGKSAALADASLEPALTVVVRLGTTCVRRLDAACAQKGTVAMCR